MQSNPNRSISIKTKMNLFNRLKTESCVSCRLAGEQLEPLFCDGKICSTCRSKNELFKCSLCKQQHGTTDATKALILERLERSLDEIDEGFRNSDLKLATKCEYIKDEIELCLQSTIDDLMALKQNLVDEVIEYETKCRKNIDDQDAKLKFQKTLEKSREKLSEWDQSKKFTDGDAKNVQAQLETCKHNYNKFVSLDRVIEYKPRQKVLDATLLGTLIYQQYRTVNNRYVLDICRLKDVKQPKQISYNLPNRQTTAIHQCYFAAICDDNFFLCTNEVQMHHFKIGLRIFDKTGILIRENDENSHLRLVAACAYDKWIVIVVHDHFHQHTLKLYDTSLTLARQLVLNYIPIRLTTDAKHIFVMSHHHAPYLYTYTMDLENLETRIKIPSTLNCEIYVRMKKFYLKSNFQRSLHIYDVESGDLINTLECPTETHGRLIDIDAASNLIFFKENKLTVLNDDKGDVLLEKTVASLPSFHIIGLTENGSIFVHDHFVDSFYLFC
jgi:hypothetical protein